MHELQLVYANYLLEYDWDVFYTQTFRRRRNDGINAALACWNILELRLGWTRAFMAVEAHRLGGVHLHCLLSNELIDWQNPVSGMRELKAQVIATEKYTEKAFGWNHVSTARNLATVSLYCSKYVTKQYGDYYYLGHWSK